MAYERRSFTGGAAITTITGDINATATTITLASSTGWPTGSAGKFYVVIDPDTGSEEKVLVATRSGTALTVSSAADRGVDNTSAISHTAGATIYLSFTGKDADEANYTVSQTVGKVISKGDMIVASGSNAFVRLPVGSNGQWPVADSSAPSGYSMQSLPDGGVTTAAKLASNVVTTAKILDANVTAAKMAANSIVTASIVDANVTAAKMATNSVATASIVDDAVTAAKVADGAIDDTAKLADGIVTKAKIEGAQQLPAGVTMPFAGSSAPTGWLLCNGAAVSRTTYAALFAVVATTYGSGDGSTTFNVPDYRGRIPVGLDNMGTTDAGRLSVANTLGAVGGEEEHTLSTGEIPAHTHTDLGHQHGIGGSAGSSGAFGGVYAGVNPTTLSAFGVANIQPTGGSGSHNNLQPYILQNWLVKT